MTDTPQAELRRTPLHELHLALRGKMVPFAGYEMPVQYTAGVLKEHLHTREKAGLFDVSHMGQAMLTGHDAAAALERLTPADVVGLKDGQQRYALLLSDAGTIKDDFMVARLTDEPGLFLVVNAACKEDDFAYISDKLKGLAILEPLTDRALLALQGPRAEAVLKRHVPGVENLTFMQIARFDIGGAAAIISRSGYTGEDGFEISVHVKDAEGFAQRLIAEPDVLPIGLGARDSLRLEAGLCLYGHDMDDKTCPVTASLSWSIGKRRKTAKDFPGAEAVMDRLANGAPTKRVGIRPDGKAPAREGTEIADKTGRVIGRITSGGFGPTLGAPIAMGYVERAFAADGTGIDLMVRGQAMPAHVAAMPFVPHRYKR
jgi:aminomethyltransferase